MGDSLSNTSTGYVSFSDTGLSANPRIRWCCWEDVVAQPLEEILIAGRPFLRVRGHFWEADLELRFFCKGYGKRADENWIRTLDIAVSENPKIADALFCPMVRSWPVEWFTACEPMPGLTILERRYRRFLPSKFQGLGMIR